MSDLRKVAQALLARWDSPQWEWAKHGPTADLIADLRAALAQPDQPTTGTWAGDPSTQDYASTQSDQPTADGAPDWRAMHKVFAHWFLSQHAKTALIPEDVAWAAWKQAYAEGVAQERERLNKTGLPSEYMLAKLQLVMPLFQEARDALTAITETQRKLHGISSTLADRMDEAGTYSMDDWQADAIRKG